jgi:hypothetical protein
MNQKALLSVVYATSFLYFCRKRNMEKSKIYKKLEDLKAEMHEPVATYGKPSETVQDVVADYVWEDVRIGMEQYRRGECRSVEEFLKKYGR